MFGSIYLIIFKLLVKLTID